MKNDIYIFLDNGNNRIHFSNSYVNDLCNLLSEAYTVYKIYNFEEITDDIKVLIYISFSNKTYSIFEYTANIKVVYIELRNSSYDIYDQDSLFRKKFLEMCSVVVYHDKHLTYSTGLGNEIYIPKYIKYNKKNKIKYIKPRIKNDVNYIDRFLSLGYKVYSDINYNKDFFVNNNYTFADNHDFMIIDNVYNDGYTILNIWKYIIDDLKLPLHIKDNITDIVVLNNKDYDLQVNHNVDTNNYIHTLSGDLELFNNIHLENTPLYEMANLFFEGYFVYDRIGNLNNLSKYRLKDKKVEIKEDRKIPSFEELIDITSLGISQKYDNVYVMWSGGIDSTCVLSSFLKNSNKKINVLMTESSKIENYTFFKHIEDKCHLIYFNNKNNQHIFGQILNNKDNTIVSGQHGDDLFILKEKDIYSELYDSPWKKSFKTIFLMHNFHGVDDTIDLLELYFRDIIEIKTYSQALLFLKFALRWDYIDNEFFHFMNEKYINYTNFFGSMYFQTWFITKFHENNFNRHVMKEYIFSYFPDLNYFRNKEKHSSAFYSQLRNFISINGDKCMFKKNIPVIFYRKNTNIIRNIIIKTLEKYKI